MTTINTHLGPITAGTCLLVRDKKAPTTVPPVLLTVWCDDDVLSTNERILLEELDPNEILEVHAPDPGFELDMGMNVDEWDETAAGLDYLDSDEIVPTLTAGQQIIVRDQYSPAFVPATTTTLWEDKNGDLLTSAGVVVRYANGNIGQTYTEFMGDQAVNILRPITQ